MVPWYHSHGFAMVYMLCCDFWRDIARSQIQLNDNKFTRIISMLHMKNANR